ncbi:MAG TPA: RNA-binding cell elongation regulator Jag/EloR, partial [Candidatus Limnocylindria bacterium]|nr:RNA-binding cell elongation regulator Jag/EloR [Candidatus Limnocylindria bacterium]
GGGRGRTEGRARERRESRPREARTEARADRPAREPAPFIPAKPLEELSESDRAALEEAKSVLEELLRLMDLEGTVEIGMGTETAKLNVKGSDLGVLIGRRGEKLASLQHLVNLIVAKREGQHSRIAIDVENYRGRREQQLRDVAERAAQRVIQSGKIIQLEPMPAIERRIVHLALVDNPRIRTQSVGVEPNRRIVVLPATKIEGEP